MQDPALMEELLADVGYTLKTFGTLVDQETDEVIPFDPDRIAPYLQNTTLDFVTNTPRQESGHKKWLLELASRQVGKTLCAALACYVRTAYSPGVYSAVIADTKERTEDLFRGIINCHQNMPSEVRAPTIASAEKRQLTFWHNGKLRTLTAGGNMVGIGRSATNLHMSELPFWDDAAEAWNGIYPGVVNRKNAMVIMESTPAPMHKPSAEWFKDQCLEARLGRGRWQFVFSPFYSSLLNERRWDPSWTLTKVEQEYLNKFGPKHGEPISNPGEWRYLTLENLAFRREVMRDDTEIRRHPELFDIYFPKDPLTCWVNAGGAAIPPHALARHLQGILVPWPEYEIYQEYEDPEPGAIYVLGADPAGYGDGDQCSFHILKVWADEWVQVATFSTNTADPHTFARVICEKAERYNNAMVIVENNGVGLGTLSILDLATADSGVLLPDELGRERRYHIRELYYHELASKAGNSPGIPAGAKTNAEGLAILIDALMDRLTLRDELTVDQLGTYRRDKEVAPSDKWSIVNPGKTQKGRKPKHHWDRVSALIWACYGATHLPLRHKPKTPEEREAADKELEELDKKGLTPNQMKALRADHARLNKQRARRKRRGRSRYR